MRTTKQSFTLFSGLFLLLFVGYLLLRSVFFAPSASAESTAATYTVLLDTRNQPTIQVSGSGSNVTLPDIYAGVGGISQTYLLALDANKWRLNINLLLGTGVTLTLSPQTGVQELQLRSGNNQVTDTAVIDYNSFVYLKTQHGTMLMDSVKVYSWDVATNGVDEKYENGRAYILAKGEATLTISNTEISYLGSGDGESYGVSWRDVNDTATPNVLRTRVTGDVINSNIHHNYYGIYTYQAQNMRFIGNQVHHNVRYGFDPHDYSHDILIENNLAYSNGAHGIIISRACNRFTIRNNKSYNNVALGASLAHGFMLDPGSPTGEGVQIPSTNNLLENNEAYGNDGYGLRILDANQNEFRNNSFHHNNLGISVDSKSYQNTISGNQIYSNTTSGILFKESSHHNTVSDNQIYGNSGNGIQMRGNDNVVRGNVIQQNLVSGVAFSLGTLAEIPVSNQIISNTITNHLAYGIDLRNTERNLIAGNVIANSNFHGVAIGGSAKQNQLRLNTIRNNGGLGISASGAQVISNTWSQNAIYANQGGGIVLGQGANQSLAAPVLTGVVDTSLSGTAPAGALVEIFADSATQGQYYEGQAQADVNGRFVFAVVNAWKGANLTAINADSTGNASGFSAPLQAPIVVTPNPSETPVVSPTLSTTPVPSVTPIASVTPVPSVTPSPNMTPVPSITPIASETPTTIAPTPRETPNPTPSPSSTVVTEQPSQKNYLPVVHR